VCGGYDRITKSKEGRVRLKGGAYLPRLWTDTPVPRRETTQTIKRGREKAAKLTKGGEKKGDAQKRGEWGR